MVGLEFWVRFRRPIYADETINLEWLVVKITPNEKLRGDIVELIRMHVLSSCAKSVVAPRHSDRHRLGSISAALTLNGRICSHRKSAKSLDFDRHRKELSTAFR
jgi:hypothetical protein